MIHVISDFHNVRGVVEMPEGAVLETLKAEFYALNQAGPNPRNYDTPEQAAWIERHNQENERLVALYGGDPCGPFDDQDRPRKYVFAVATFIGWLVKEKGAKRVPHRSFCLVEFD